MKARAILLAGTFFAAAALPAQVHVTVKDGRTLIRNDGPANLGASDSWLAARVRQPSAYDALIEAAALQNDLDPKLVKSVMLIESGFNPAAISKKGARGLMQLMPEVAVEQGVRDVHDPKQNIDAGTRELSRLHCTGFPPPAARPRYVWLAGIPNPPPSSDAPRYAARALCTYSCVSAYGGTPAYRSTAASPAL